MITSAACIYLVAYSICPGCLQCARAAPSALPNVPAAGTLCGGRRPAASSHLAAPGLCPPISRPLPAQSAGPAVCPLTRPWPGASGAPAQGPSAARLQRRGRPPLGLLQSSPPRGRRSVLAVWVSETRPVTTLSGVLLPGPRSPHFTSSSFSKLQPHTLAPGSREALEWLGQEVPLTPPPAPAPASALDPLGRRRGPSSVLPTSSAAPDPRPAPSPVQTAPPLPHAVPSRTVPGRDKALPDRVEPRETGWKAGA